MPYCCAGLVVGFGLENKTRPRFLVGKGLTTHQTGADFRVCTTAAECEDAF